MKSKTVRVKRRLISCKRGKCFPKQSDSIRASALTFLLRSSKLLKIDLLQEVT